MRSFTDAAGRDWRIKITVAELEAIEEAVGIDLGARGAMERITGSVRKFLEVLWVLLGPQIEQRGQEDPAFTLQALKESWAESDTWEAAHEAVLLAVADFFRTGQQAETTLAFIRKRTAELKAIKTAKVQEIEAAMQTGLLDRKLMPELARLDELLASAAPSRSAGASPASSASTPAP